jgi:hypothetical protein
MNPYLKRQVEKGFLTEQEAWRLYENFNVMEAMRRGMEIIENSNLFNKEEERDPDYIPGIDDGEAPQKDEDDGVDFTQRDPLEV